MGVRCYRRRTRGLPTATRSTRTTDIRSTPPAGLAFVATSECTSPTSARRESHRVRHAFRSRVSRTRHEARSIHCEACCCWRECRSVQLFWLDIWRPYCACVKRASVPRVTRTTMHFARCGIRCTMPRWSAPRAVKCDMRRRQCRIAITCDTRVVWERSILGQSALGARTAERVGHRQRAYR